jgi:putative flippase GtrA
MAFPAPGLYSRVRTSCSRIRPLLPELIKFCVVGGIGAVVDLGGAALLHGKYHVEPLAAKAISTAVATVVTYLGSRFWTFKHRENQELKREAVLFIVLNLVGLLIAEIVVGFTTYALNLHSQLEYNGASFVGTGLATIFRYFAYKRWVFLAPGEQVAATSAPATTELADYPPWELDPAFLGPNEATPDEAVPSRPAAEAPLAAPEPEPAPAYSSPWPDAPAVQAHEPSRAYSSPWPDAPAPEPTAAHSSPWADAPAVPAPDATPAPGREAAAAAAPRSPGGRHRRS